MSAPRCYECGHILADINAWCPQCCPHGGEPGTVDHARHIARKATARAEAAESALAEARERITRLEEALQGIADGFCCETPGCSTEDPKCDTMLARAALKDQP